MIQAINTIRVLGGENEIPYLIEVIENPDLDKELKDAAKVTLQALYKKRKLYFIDIKAV